MQIYALDHQSRLVPSNKAVRGITYLCPECSSELRVRGGLARQVHYYHVNKSSCILHGKSLTHLQIQLSLQKMLTPEHVQLECRFPPINRIADVVWPSERLVFEVQISPISPEEVKARNRDYAKIGYRVVWILHDRRYNRSRLTGAEIALRSSPHYFTNINALGRGIFYDQYATVLFKRRQKRTSRYPVHFKKLMPVNPKQFPRHFPAARKAWPFSFSGDLFQKNIAWIPPPKTWHHMFLRLYRFAFHFLLEKTTR
jgi:competence protein CoiA